MNSYIEYGQRNAILNSNRTKILKFEQKVKHKALNETKVITAPNEEALNVKIHSQIEIWNKKWIAVQTKRIEAEEREAAEKEALEQTRKAERIISNFENILIKALDKEICVDWNEQKRHDRFPTPAPCPPETPIYVMYPPAPEKTSVSFLPKKSIATALSKTAKEKSIINADKLFESTLEFWKQDCERIKNLNEQQAVRHEQAIKEYQIACDEWKLQEDIFLKEQQRYNDSIDHKINMYQAHDPMLVELYCSDVLEKSDLPTIFNKDFQLSYLPDSKILIIDYMLPSVDDFPTLKEVRYVPSKKIIQEVFYNRDFIESLFDSTIYKFLLRVLHEVFSSDKADAIKAVSVNGYVNFLNKATGKHETACLASLQVEKEKFSEINLFNVDAKLCFRGLKGVGSSKLSGLTPIKPILTISREDKRFVDSHNVADSFDSSTNIAAIPWDEFEHLIREIFEKEFSVNGGEVKVTQASRDGGVDAIAFDPDPIRGGKIVIQAKRYTNVVGVSAVRDLYGTVMNEGATKGILVTTATYGPDAYEFVKNKPLTLLSGSELLYLLEKHGHQAKIDLKEAKEINQANNRR